MAAPVDGTSQEGLGSSTAIVPIRRQPSAVPALGTQHGLAHSNVAYDDTQDGYIWTVSVEDNGTFSFYAAPRTSYGGSSLDDSGTQSWQQMWTGWISPSGLASGLHYANAQYALYAGMDAMANGQLLNLYA